MCILFIFKQDCFNPARKIHSTHINNDPLIVERAQKLISELDLFRDTEDGRKALD